MTMIRSSLKCSLSSCWRDSNQGLWGLSSSDTNQAASPAAAAGGSSWWLLPGWWNNETGRSAKIGRWQGGCRGGGGVFGGSTAEAKQKGKHVCRGNQREGRLTTRACQRTKPAHKHGDYASESERRVTDKRNNAIKPFWSFIKVLLKKKKKRTWFYQETSAGRKDLLLGSLSLRSAISLLFFSWRRWAPSFFSITFNGSRALSLLGTADLY